jgi:histidyl-tRNA synthetase
VVNFDAARLGDYQRVARLLRAAGASVEVYPDAAKKFQIGPQLSYATKRGFKFALIAGPAEFEQGVWKVKNLAKREETAVKEEELVDRIRAGA